jgi:tetratricopeptide (TPR) repeat protein
MKTRLQLLVIGLLSIAPASLACLWDTDTIVMEKARFPEVADLIAGKFPRHSREFYEWRKKRCLSEIAKGNKTPSLLDDLAVAQHKLGDHPAAISTMQEKEAAFPGIYETYSNLGTFHIYAGDLDEAEKWISRALEINPNAHFGREKYQLWLVQWLKVGKPRIENTRQFEHSVDYSGFSEFIVKQSGFTGPSAAWKEGRAEALKGILGMMRFADHDNPVLLEALGDVLLTGDFQENAALLAAQSYLLASRKSKTDTEKQRLWKLMEQAGGTTDEYKPRDTMRTLDVTLAAGRLLLEKVRRDELVWIKSGKDVAALFAAKYLTKSAK